MKYSSWRHASLALCAFGSIHAAEPVAIIPFRLEDKLIVVDVRVNESAPTVFVVDTGASHTVLDPRFAHALGLTLKEAAPVKGAGAGAVKTSQAPPVQLSLGDFRVEIPEPWVIDLSAVPIPEKVRGLVGAEILKSSIVRIDPVARTISIFEPTSYEAPAKGMAIPLFIDERDRLFLEATLELNGKSETHKLRIDTGSASSMNHELVRQSRETHPSIGGNGLGENFDSVAGYFDSVRLGPFKFDHVWATGDPGPAIGMELLGRFVLTFDAPHGRLYLEPVSTR